MTKIFSLTLLRNYQLIQPWDLWKIHEPKVLSDSLVFLIIKETETLNFLMTLIIPILDDLRWGKIIRVNNLLNWMAIIIDWPITLQYDINPATYCLVDQ